MLWVKAKSGSQNRWGWSEWSDAYDLSPSTQGYSGVDGSDFVSLSVEFIDQAVEMVIHSGKSQVRIARELGVSGYSLNLWKKAYLGRQQPAEVDGQGMSPQQMFEKIRQLQKENEYLKRQREILKKAMSILGEEPTSGMR